MKVRRMTVVSRAIKGLACALAGVAAAGSVAMGAGPDVIVGDIPDVSNFTSGGAVGGFRAYSIGTTSCNLGTQELTWNSGTNQHPVISQNLYRLANGRYEQIGQAWLKHGFCALQGTVCSSGCSPSPLGCGALGILCSDPYSASLNGGQSGLGPKWQVNASSGLFPFPYTDSSGSGELYKRLQALDTDLTTAGASYFVASMYVQPEDAAAHNNNNNESYRRVSFAAGSRNMTLLDSTQRMQPGIQAWKDNDPAVTLTNVDVASDGRFIVASKATDLGGGVWHYEYAVQNLNSNRSGQAFGIPIPSGSAVTNVGFHDVPYHSGEPNSAGADWTPTVGATSVSWATSVWTSGTDTSTNALRWDTIYNYRFDCNAAPGSGSATITLFRPGSPATATGVVVVPGGGPPPPPVNDLCANASSLSNGVTAFNTANATSDAATQTACGNSANFFNDVWYVYSSPCAGSVTMTTCGATFDTKLAVYPACPGGNNTAIVCNDDNNACGTNSLQSSLTFAAAAGTTYVVRLGSFTNGVTGSGNLTVTGPSCGPPGDFCATPIALVGNTAAIDNTAATTDGPTETLCDASGDNQVSKDIWYRWVAPCSGSTTVDLCTATFDTKLAVYAACPSSPNTAIVCNDDACGTGGLRSRVTFAAVGGTAYLIRLGGYQGASGTGTLTVTPPVCGPSNDNCAAAVAISSYGATAFTNVAASNDGPAPTTCGTGNDIGADVWYTYTACVDGVHTVDTCVGGNFDSVILVYTGACGALTSVGCNDDACGTGGLSSNLSWTAVAGTLYHIRVGGYQGASGAGTLTLAGPVCPPPAPANDNCNNRAGVGLGPTNFTTVGATTDGPDHPLCDNAGSAAVTNDIWYNYPSQCPGALTVDTCGSTFDTKLAVYDDAGCVNYETRLMACNDDACGADGLSSRITVAVQRGRNYTIRVGGYSGATGTGVLTLACCPADFNASGIVSVQDIFDFLAAYFANSPRADFNGSGLNSVQDIFDFLAAYFTGC
jgi:hypothetical protein